MPERLRELQGLFHAEGERHQVFPLDDRVTERENSEFAGRYDVYHGRMSVIFGPNTGRLTEEAAPNVKNRSHTITVEVEVGEEAPTGVLIAQGGRFGGWSLYCHRGQLCYAYNCYGRDLTTIRADQSLEAGKHTLTMDFAYDGGPPGDAATVRLLGKDTELGIGRIPATTAYYFSFDETFNVGVDRGTPVTDDYAPVRNAFTGSIHQVRIALGPQRPPDKEGRERLSRATYD